MFNDVNSIQISGGCYNEGTTLENILAQRLNIVYGRNGSGKSSLAKAIYDYAHNEADPKFDITFIPELSADAKTHMFVYSEDFVINNVKLQKDGLDQIVMIGEQVDLSNKEDELKETEKNLTAQFEEKKNFARKHQRLKGTSRKKTSRDHQRRLCCT